MTRSGYGPKSTQQSYNGRKTHCPRGHALVPGNLVAALQKRGWRSCLSCQRARSYLSYHPESMQSLKELSDEYYLRFLEERRPKFRKAH